MLVLCCIIPFGILCSCTSILSYDSTERWVAPAVRRGLINPGKRQISVPGGGSTLTHHHFLIFLTFKVCYTFQRYSRHRICFFIRPQRPVIRLQSCFISTTLHLGRPKCHTPKLFAQLLCPPR